MRISHAVLATALLSATALSGCATAEQEIHNIATQGNAHEQETKARETLPHCTRSHGTLAVREPQGSKWWEPLGLPNPEAMIKVMVSQSGCFVTLDRGKGFEMLEQERALSSGGQLRQGSNLGRGQLKAADYILVPDISSKNNDASGSAATAILGSLIGGGAGAIISSIHMTDKTADTVLTLTDVRTGEDVAMAEGHGEHTDWGFGAGAGVAGMSGFGAAGAGSYENTDIGQVVTLAYVDAYRKLLNERGYLPTSASAAAPAQALAVTHAGHLFKGPSAKSGVIRAVSPGMMLYPTGEKSGGWREVKDELGNTGWVAYQVIELAK
ncbi:MAG: peptidoglycan-binding protein [Patescibacteria group bacterium]|nr:peptidoglycan-binding protein [Patescibacteria group bacterium]MDE1965929.1 peptidoglycan-binding protein [Patescibacteria group bacterium]